MNRFSIVVASAAVVVVAAAGCQPVPEAGTLARGEELYMSCRPCHGKEAGGTMVVGAPAIGGLPQWYVEAQLMKFRAGKRGYHFDDAAGLRMRPMSMIMANEQDVKDVAQFVASLPRPAHAASIQGGNPEHGKAIFATCQACHGADGAGNQALNAPSLAGADDWYLLAQLGKYKSKLRGDPAVDPVGGTMQAMASATLPDENAMKDVIAYIKTLPVKPALPPASPPKGG